MKKLLLPLVVLIFTTLSIAQEVKKDEWIRVQSDEGEFSIEIPSEYGYFYDKIGTTIPDDRSDYELTEMTVLNAYIEGTLVSFETYRAGKRGLQLIESANENDAKWQKAKDNKSEIKKTGYKIKQHISKNDTQYSVRQYFASNKYIYVLTSSSRRGETATMNRFFDSLIFKPNANIKLPSSNSRFPDLNLTSITYEEQFETTENNNQLKLPAQPQTPDPTVTKLELISQPKPSFTDLARKNNEQGKIRIKVTFSESGQITKVVGLRTLQFGLYRNALMAALRVKYLPQEKNNIPVTVAKTIEYSFTIY